MSKPLPDAEKARLKELAKKAQEDGTLIDRLCAERILKEALAPSTITALLEELEELREIGREQAVTLHNVLNHTFKFEDCDIQRCAEWQKFPVKELMKQRAESAEAERDRMRDNLKITQILYAGAIEQLAEAALTDKGVTKG